MSLLGCYTMTIDDKDGSLTLASKGSASEDSEDGETPDEEKVAERNDSESPAPTK